MTTCMDVVHITGMHMFYKPYFQHCLDNVLYLFTDLGPEPSAEECKAVDNKMYQRIRKKMGLSYAEYWKNIEPPGSTWNPGQNNWVGYHDHPNYISSIKDRCMNWFNDGSAKEWME